MHICYYICVGNSTRAEAKSTYINIARRFASYHVAGLRRIVEMFAITAKAEPSLGVPCTRGLLNVAEGNGVCVGRDLGTPGAENVA